MNLIHGVIVVKRDHVKWRVLDRCGSEPATYGIADALESAAIAVRRAGADSFEIIDDRFGDVDWN